jgi:DNA-binding NtrC family response regulator
MSKELHILILEDNANDAELMERELRNAGIVLSSKRVETKEDFLKELREFSPDLILSDYSLPQFDGLSALAIAQEKCPDIPFILVSGAIGEDLAIETLKKGATDYVLKSHLSRLVPSIMRALREAEERREYNGAVEALRESEEKYRTIFENTGTATVISVCP